MNKQKKPTCNAGEPNKANNNIDHQPRSVKKGSFSPEKDPRQKTLFTEEELKEQPLAGRIWRAGGLHHE